MNVRFTLTTNTGQTTMKGKYTNYTVKISLTQSLMGRIKCPFQRSVREELEILMTNAIITNATHSLIQ